MAEQEHRAEEQDILPSEGEEFAKRRQVIKGLISAVPVIMTVSSASAMGANASSYQCLTKDFVHPAECIDAPSEQTYNDGETYVPDGWYRRYSESDHKFCTIKYVDQNGMGVVEDVGGHPLSYSCANSFNFI